MARIPSRAGAPEHGRKDVLIPEDDGVPIVVHQWIDPRPPEWQIQPILAEIAADHREYKQNLAAISPR